MQDPDGPGDRDQATPADDVIVPFQLDGAGLRGRLARLDATLDAILSQHRYPEPVSGLVADAVLLTALIGEAIKLRWRLSIQVRGEGAVRLIATDYFAPETEGGPARMRAYASFDRGDVASTRGAPFELLGRGIFGLTIDQGPKMSPYQGITPLTGGSLAACAETYFAQSEQLATRFYLLSAFAQAPGQPSGWRGGGVMLQQLPQVAPELASKAPSGEDGLMTGDDVAGGGEPGEAWSRVNILSETLEEHELIGPIPDPDGLIWRLYNEERPRVFPPQRLRFGCTCSASRVEDALAQYSAKDIAQMTTDDGIVTADCQFCSAHYEFDPETLGFEGSRSD